MARYVLIDTDVLIDAGRNIVEAVAYLGQIEGQYTQAISVVTQLELIVGCRSKRELGALAKFLRRFRVFELNEPISRIAVGLLTQYRLSHGLLIADALIAATTIHLQQPFVTKNQRDCHFISELTLLPYPQSYAL